MCRVIADARPSFVLGENVPGIVTMDLDRVLADLEGIGYATRTLIIPACAVDARHRRERVWIMGYSERERLLAKEGRRMDGQILHQIERREISDATGRPSCDVAVADSNGRETRLAEGRPEASILTDADSNRRWPAEPGVGRVVHGLAGRVDRIKALGNGQVPVVVASAWEVLA